jgi:endonuclease-3
MLVATILSQNTNDTNSHRAYLSLRNAYRSWPALRAAPVRSIAAAIRVGGMAHQKSGRIRNLLNTLQHRHGSLRLGFLSRQTDDEVLSFLTSFDGIGPKTAACVLLFSLGRNVVPVDTHVHRICSRLALVPPTNSPEQTFARLRPLVPEGKAYSLHVNLIIFGRTICRSSRPRCGTCPLAKACHYEHKSHQIQKSLEGAQVAGHRFMLLDQI